MKTSANSKKLQTINGESNLQKRLSLLVKHDFRHEATQLIWDLARTHTLMFHCDWHEPQFCNPLPRVTSENAAVYVIITTSSKLDYHPNTRSVDDQHVIFELGWERSHLLWTEEESREFVRLVLAQALARPLNQWSFKQAEGTGRAVRRLLPVEEPMAREIAALHLVYHLREADFGHICDYLADIQGFPFRNGIKKIGDMESVVNWIVEQLIGFGWTSEHIRKELAEWIWLKTDAWPQSLLAVAGANIFDHNDPIRAAAVRRWIRQGFDKLLDSVSGQRGGENLATIYTQLFEIGKFGVVDEGWVVDKLVRQMALGKARSVKCFITEFARTLGFGEINLVRARAIESAMAAQNYGIAAALIKDSGTEPDRDLVDIVELRSLGVGLQ